MNGHRLVPIKKPLRLCRVSHCPVTLRESDEHRENSAQRIMDLSGSMGTTAVWEINLTKGRCHQNQEQDGDKMLDSETSTRKETHLLRRLGVSFRPDLVCVVWMFVRILFLLFSPLNSMIMYKMNGCVGRGFLLILLSLGWDFLRRRRGPCEHLQSLTTSVEGRDPQSSLRWRELDDAPPSPSLPSSASSALSHPAFLLPLPLPSLLLLHLFSSSLSLLLSPFVFLCRSCRLLLRLCPESLKVSKWYHK